MRQFFTLTLFTAVLLRLSLLWGIAGEEPQIPAAASWAMTLEQVQRLPELERNVEGNLLHSYIIRSASKDEFVALWKERPISFLVAKDIGLYAINVEMTPRALQHTQDAADQELLDLKHWAPVRLAIMQKYGPPLGLATTWNADTISSLSTARESTTVAPDRETIAIQWPYARNWLVWEGVATRLALGEQSVWYASRVGLAKQQRTKEALEEEQDLRELARRAARQQLLEDARDAVVSRASTVESFF